MIITDITKELPFPHRTPTNRAEGVHLTDVIKDIHKELFPREAFKDIEDMSAEERDKTFLNFEMGFIWEDALSLAFGDRLATRYDDVWVEGILCNPDGVELVEVPKAIHEYKMTKMSSLKCPSENWRWKSQTLGYCYAFGVTTVKFIVLHINGDYRGDRGPTYKATQLDFTEQEVLENWEMVKNHAQKKGWIK